ncbi:MAG: glycosyltransferase family 2 protein [Bacillota bacterium]
MRAVALIPAYNAAETIEATITALRSIPEIGAVLVVDDGSLDETAHLAAAAGAEVIRHPQNMGKGAALNTGLAALRGRRFEALALVDGDLGDSAVEFARLLAPVLAGRAEMTIARFPPAKKRGGFGLAKGFCRLGLRLFTGQWFASPMSGQRVLSATLLDRLPGFAPGWGCEPALTIEVHRLGGRILEVPVEMSHAETGRNLKDFVHRGRQLLAAAKVFLRAALGFRLVPLNAASNQDQNHPQG